MELREIRDKVIKLTKEGKLISFKDIMQLYDLFKKENFEIDDEIKITIDILKKEFKNSSNTYEKSIINNLIFVLEFINSKDSLKDFIKRTLQVNRKEDNEYSLLAFAFIKEYEIEEEIFLKSIKEILSEYFNFDKTTRRSIFINLLSELWNNKKYFNNPIWLEIFDDAVALLNKTIEKNLIDEQMYIHFFTYHIYGNNIHTIDEWRIFNEKVEKPASKFYKKWGENNKLKQPKKEISKGVKKIGILVDRLVLNSPMIITYSLLKALSKQKEYELYLYSMNYIDKNPDEQNIINMFNNIGVKVFSPQNYFIKDGFYYSHLKKALMIRDLIIKDEIDYLISGFGYDIPNFIFSNRSAPKQLFWSHGNCTSEIEGIDKRISHFNQECEEFEWEIFNVPIAEEFLIGSKEEKEKGLLLKKSLLETFGENTVILGTIGRLIKIDSDEYIKVIAEIMKENPNTIYLACGSGNEKSIKEKLKKHDIDQNRFIFTGHVNPHVFGWVIDVWPDSFPLRQGNSLSEYRSKGKAYVVMYIQKYIDEINKGKIKKELYSKEELLKIEKGEPLFKENPHAKSYRALPAVMNKEEYIKVANLLINNLEIRKKVEEESRLDDSEDNKKILNFLKELND